MYGIKATYSYYGGTLFAPKNGFLRDEDDNVLKFGTTTEALNYLNRYYGKMELDNGKATYSNEGRYVLNHGEYSRPRYTIAKIPTTMRGKKITHKRK